MLQYVLTFVYFLFCFTYLSCSNTLIEKFNNSEQYTLTTLPTMNVFVTIAKSPPICRAEATIEQTKELFANGSNRSILPLFHAHGFHVNVVGYAYVRGTPYPDNSNCERYIPRFFGAVANVQGTDINGRNTVSIDLNSEPYGNAAYIQFANDARGTGDGFTYNKRFISVRDTTRNILAHEIGHAWGLGHNGSISPCHSGNWVMCSTIFNGNDRFSQVEVNFMKQYMENIRLFQYIQVSTGDYNKNKQLFEASSTYRQNNWTFH